MKKATLIRLLMVILVFQSFQENEVRSLDFSEGNTEVDVEADIFDCLTENYSTEPGLLIAYGLLERTIALTDYDEIEIFQRDIMHPDEQIGRMLGIEDG